jgi:peptidyl-prolyl cis-trans isomerase C
MPPRVRVLLLACAGVAVLAGAVFLAVRKRGGEGPARVVGSFRGGTLTARELEEGVQRLAPALRREFDSAAGRREVARSLIDKKLLAAEARRRHIDGRPDIRRQIEELEDRLIVQALLADEEKSAGAAPDDDLRRYYDEHRREFDRPERVRVARVLAAVGPASSAEAKARARKRAEEFQHRLRKAEPLAKVAAAGDGPERKEGGQLGWLARSDRDAATSTAAFALQRPGEMSAPVLTPDGWSVLVLLERAAARTPAFTEVREEIVGRADAARRRRAFDSLLAGLRREGEVHVAFEGSR